MKEKKLGFIGCIPRKEQEYLMNLNKSSSPYISKEGLCQSHEDYTKHSFYISGLANLQHIVSIYNKALDTLINIDMECYPEIHELQTNVCDSLVKAYYEEKDENYSYLGHLDIYNPDIEGMSSRNGMMPIVKNIRISNTCKSFMDEVIDEI